MLLKDYRKLLGLSRAKMAEKIGTTGPTVYRWETGRMVPNPTSMRAIRTATQGAVTADDLLRPFHDRHQAKGAA